ncbi:GGDEF domain-containing protein [Vibrio nitrifigilis]|uniref:diguanylate cyclase n=1 Tax=Vibrio nitrifigilis TaxID=2789781 RepID=A0ABS0GI79_9VIBR|nr:GGDEF domain-containing protein [Vibrio nitrifigilis]MBF9002104.1 GGDEF domain-containing protein [Vibrio nitrifigilis]
MQDVTDTRLVTDNIKLARKNNNIESECEKIRQLELENKVLKDKVNQLEQIAYYDSLTGLSNRELCIEKLNQFIEDQKLKNVSVVFLDLDNLKVINDMFGHSAGDMALCHFSNILAYYCPEDAFVARYGGDEFVVLLPEYDMLLAKEWCKSLDNELNTRMTMNEQEDPCVQFSSGIYTFCHSKHTGRNTGIVAKRVIALADRAMYVAKRAKKK